MDKNDLKVGDELLESSNGNIWEVSEILEDTVWITRGSSVTEAYRSVLYEDLKYYEKVVTMNISEEESRQLQKEGARLSEEKPICYNHIKVTQLIETLKQLAQINELDINNLTILRTSYNPEDGSMLFDIKLN